MKMDAITLREINMPLAHPFETSFGVTTGRRILLVEIESGEHSAWGECVAGEHPYFSDEMIDTAWHIVETELAPRLLKAEVSSGSDCPGLFEQVRGHRMAKAALENAVWELDAVRQCVPLARLLGGTRELIPCGVSIGIQATMDKQMEKIETELAAGYQRIKLKCKPGWDRFNLLMIEQPLWYDDFYFHRELQKRLKTALCLDECIRNRRDAQAALELGSGRIINIKVGRVGGFTEALAIHDIAQEHGVPVWCGGMLETGIGRAHNIALSSLPNFKLPGDVSASSRYWSEDIIDPPVTVSSNGEIPVPWDKPGRGYEVDRERIERSTVRRLRLQA